MRSHSRVAWLEPLDSHDAATFSPPHVKDLLVPGTMGTYYSLAMSGVVSAAVAIGLGLGRPAVLALVMAAHCVVAGLVVGGAAVSARVRAARGDRQAGPGGI